MLQKVKVKSVTMARNSVIFKGNVTTTEMFDLNWTSSGFTKESTLLDIYTENKIKNKTKQKNFTISCIS